MYFGIIIYIGICFPLAGEIAIKNKMNNFETIAMFVFFPVIAAVYLILWTFKILVAFVKILGKIFKNFDDSLEGNKDDEG